MKVPVLVSGVRKGQLSGHHEGRGDILGKDLRGPFGGSPKACREPSGLRLKGKQSRSSLKLSWQSGGEGWSACSPFASRGFCNLLNKAVTGR